MQTVVLSVQVKREELDKLVADVNGLQNQVIRFRVETEGIDRLNTQIREASQNRTMTFNVDAAGAQRSLDAVSNSLTRIQRTFNDAGELTREVRDFNAGLGETTRQIREMTEEGERWTQIETTNIKKQQEAQNIAQARLQLERDLVEAKRIAGARNAKISEIWDGDQLKKFTQTYRDSGGQVVKVTEQIKDGILDVNRAVSQDFARGVSAFESMMGDTFANIFVKMAAWQLMGNFVGSLIRSVKSAVAEIKEVDTALVDIRKTTDLTDGQIRSFTEDIYNMATAYGRTASELVNASVTFARAGFQDNLEQMTELSALLQNVGDLSEEQASKFLLAANAAWKLNGDFDSLMLIIDGLNAQTNEAAVDMDALTQAIQVSGSVMAAAGETTQAYAAMVGTAVSVTQRSGNEIGRAMRTISMRVRQVKGELDDGEVVSAEDISKAAEALDSVGISISGMDGELRKTSDILSELAGKWKTLDSWQKAYVTEALAGKMQGNILTAILENWEEVERQMQLYANGAGSAMRENEIYLDSWEAKSKQLHAAWTEFASEFVNTDIIKNALDGLIGIVKGLDAGVAQLGITFATVAAASGKLMKVAAEQRRSAELAREAAEAGRAAGAAGVALFNQTSVIIGLTVTALVALYSIYDKINISLDEQKQKVAELQTEYNRLYGSGSEFENLVDRESELNDLETKRLSILRAQKQAMEDQLETKKKLEFEKFQKEQGSGKKLRTGSAYYDESGNFQSGWIYADTKALKDLSDEYNNLTQQYYAAQIGEEQYRQGLAKLISDHKDYYEALKKYQEAEYELSEHEKGLITLYESVAGKYNDVTVAANEATEAIDQQIEAEERGYETADELEKKVKAVKAALSDYKEYNNLTTDAINGLKEAIPGLVEGLYNEEGKLSDAGIAALENAQKIKENRIAVEYLQAAASAANYQNLINQIRQAGITAANSMVQLQGLAAAAMALSNSGAASKSQMDGLMRTARERAKVNGTSVEAEYAKELTGYVSSQAKTATNAAATIYANAEKVSTKSKTGKSGSSSSSTKDARLESLKDALAIEKARYELMVEQGAAEGELAAQIDVVSGKIRNLINYQKTEDADRLGYQKELLEWEEKRNSLQREGYENALSAAKKEYDFYEANGTETGVLIQMLERMQALERDYADSIRKSTAYQEAERKVKAGSTDLTKDELELYQKRNELSSSYNEQERKKEKLRAEDREKELKAHEDAISMLQSELSLLESQEDSDEQRLEFLDKLISETNSYLADLERESGKEKEINKLKQDRLGYEKQIKDIADQQEEARRRAREDVIDFQTSILNLMKMLGMEDDALIAQMKEIAARQEEYILYLRDTKATQSDLLNAMQDYASILGDIDELERSVAESKKEQADKAKELAETYRKDVVSLYRGQLELIKKMGGGTEEQIAMQRKLISAIEAEGLLLKENGASILALNELESERLDALSELSELEKGNSEENNNQLDRLKDIVDLRQSESDLAEALDLGAEERIDKLRRVADAIREQGQLMEKTGASQTEINRLAVQWLRVEKEIAELQEDIAKGVDDSAKSKAHLAYLQSVLRLRESEWTLLDAMGASDEERIDKYRQIAAAIKEVGDYQKRVGEDQAEINNTAAKWYNTLTKVLKLQQEQLDELESSALDYLKAQEDDAVSALEEQLNLLKQQKESAEKQREEQEKLLAVEKARVALFNAQHQRTVWIYNGETRRFEWVANENAVQKAREDLLRAEEELAEYQYQLQIDALQSEIGLVKGAFKDYREAFEATVEEIKSGKKTYREAYSYISEQIKSIHDKYGVDLTNIMDQSVVGFQSIADEIEATRSAIENANLSFGDTAGTIEETTSAVEEAREKLSLAFGSLYSELTDTNDTIAQANDRFSLLFGSISGELSEADYQLDNAASSLEETANLLSRLPDAIRNILDGLTGGEYSAREPGGESSGSYQKNKDIEKMRQNAAAWHSTSTAEERERLHSDNQIIARAWGFTYDNGIWYDTDGTRLFDKGGLLHGVGGIKATTRDEAVLGPEVTEKLVSQRGSETVSTLSGILDKLLSAPPNSPKQIWERFAEYGIISGERPSRYRAVADSVLNGGNVDNGLHITINGMDVSSHVSEGTTIGELAALSRNYALYC